MKSRILFIGMIAITIAFSAFNSMAQNSFKRLTVIEEFTSATCPPCVAASQALLQVVKMSNNIVSVRFHMDWPAPGDPWNLANPTDNATRKNYYNVGGIPYSRVNGIQINPQSASALLTQANSDNAEGSPVGIEVKETKTGTNDYKVEVKVNTNIALSGHTLHVAVVSRFAEYPGLKSSLPGSNGEEEFYDAMNKMLPNATGTSLNLSAGGEQTFTFTYKRGVGETWPANQQFIVAYIQNESTKRVLNAGTNLVVYRADLAAVSPVWEPINRGASAVKKVRVTNPTDKELICTLSINNEQNLTQNGWNASLSSYEVDLLPGESTEISINSTAVNRAFFCAIELAATPIVKDAIAEVTVLTTGYLTNSRVAVYAGASNGAVGQAIAAIATKFATDVAYVPLNQDVMLAFPPETSFDAIILPSGYDGRFAIPALTPIADQMLKANKGVWLTAPMGLAVALNPENQQYAGYPQAKAFFESYGLGLNSTIGRTSGQYYAQFDLAGTPNNPISNGWSAKANDAHQNWPFAMEAQDLISIQNNKSKAFVYTNGNTTNIVGVYSEEGKRKFVFSSFGAEHIANEANRNAITERVIEYLLAGTNTTNKPEITLSTPTLAFGNVEVGKTVNRTVTITNSGNADLELTGTALGGPDGTDFDIIEGLIDGGKKVTVKPNGTHAVRVQFQPSTVKASFVGTLAITGNASSPNIQLTGSSTTASVETEAVSETGAISMKLTGNNPVTEQSAVQISSSQHVQVTVVDVAGRVVATLFTGLPSGPQALSLANLNMPSGTYMVVAQSGAEQAVLSFVVAQ